MADAASDKKGIDIVTLKMRKMSGMCDYFVIASGTSTTQVRAISDHIIRQLREKGARVRHVEGEREASWILIDSGDVVGHVFLEKTRKFYGLEKLWAGAPMERFESQEPSKRAPAKKPAKKFARRPVKRLAKRIIKKTKNKSRKKSR